MLLESILGKLNNRQDSSETIESFTTKFTRTSCTCSQKFINGCPLQQLFGAGSRSLGISFEQTKQGLVWEVRNSVHTPLGKRLLQLTSNILQLAGWLYNVSLINYRLHILLQIEHHLWSIFENRF